MNKVRKFKIEAENNFCWETSAAHMFDAKVVEEMPKRRVGIKTRTISVPSFKSIVPSKTDIRYSFLGSQEGFFHHYNFLTKSYEAKKHVTNYGQTEAFELKIEKSSDVTAKTVKDFIKSALIFKDKKETVLVYNRSKNGKLMTIKDMLKKFGKRELFCFVTTNATYDVEQGKDIFVL